MTVSVVVLPEQKPLKDCDIGLFISESGELCLKTEYGLDSYIVSSGEKFWGGVSTEEELAEVPVTPCFVEGGCCNMDKPSFDDWKTSSHPSYGMISFSRLRCSQAQPLFGSSIKHRDIIQMVISHGQIDRGINHDWYHAKGRIIEVEMSQSQFADAITSLNMGDGVPCTINFTERDGNIPPCNFVNKTEQFSAEFSEQLSGVKDSLDKAIRDITELFASKKSLNKADKEQILNALKSARQNVGCNATYVFDCFTEQMDKTVKEAKGEIESFMQNRIRSFAQSAMLQQGENKGINLIGELENPIEVD